MKKLSLNDPLFAPMTNESLRQFKGGKAGEQTTDYKWTYSQTQKPGCTDTNNDGSCDGIEILNCTDVTCEC